MFFILSKTISYLILPLSLLAILLLTGLFARKLKLKRWALGLFAGLFFLFTNPFISNSLIRWWEIPPTPIHALAESYEAAIILSGVTDSQKTLKDRVYLNKGADRIMHTVQLYKLGKIRKIILSGGSGLLLEEQESSEANEMRKVLLISGVADEDILMEEKSRNTYENALFTADLIRENKLGHMAKDKPGNEWDNKPENKPDNKLGKGNLLLVTSAFHMRRSMACFRQAGLDVEAYSTDFYSSEPAYSPDKLIIPSDWALIVWTRLFREWSGYLVYGLLGYL